MRKLAVGINLVGLHDNIALNSSSSDYHCYSSIASGLCIEKNLLQCKLFSSCRLLPTVDRIIKAMLPSSSWKPLWDTTMTALGYRNQCIFHRWEMYAWGEFTLQPGLNRHFAMETFLCLFNLTNDDGEKLFSSGGFLWKKFPLKCQQQQMQRRAKRWHDDNILLNCWSVFAMKRGRRERSISLPWWHLCCPPAGSSVRFTSSVKWEKKAP